jgi:trehalose 6-phosphate synthase
VPRTNETFDLVIAANRLPVDRVVGADGEATWRTSPGGLVTAMESVMKGRDGAWVGWAGDAGEAPEPFTADDGMYLHPVALSEDEVAHYYEGFSNDTLWPIYHDVIVPATFHRFWFAAYQAVNRKFAEAVCQVAAEGATVWVHDYQLQLVPTMVRELRPDVRIGWFNHIPFPPVELFAQLPWRRAILEGLLGADYLGFQRVADSQNFIRACRQLLGLPTKGDTVSVSRSDAARRVRASAVPISIDFRGLEELAKQPETQQRAREIRESLGDPHTLIVGVDRLDYTKGIGHRIKAYGELLAEEKVAPPHETFVQVATPSRERVAAYQALRSEIEGEVGRLNGEYSRIGAPAVQYLHHAYPRKEMASLYLAADVMLVTPLRDGMNLVAKEYVTCRHDEGGALVLSEFTGAFHELHQAFVCNPHDIEGLKQTIMRAIQTPPKEKRRLMRAMRRRVADHDVQGWASRFLDNLAHAPERPSVPPTAHAPSRPSPHERAVHEAPANEPVTAGRGLA